MDDESVNLRKRPTFAALALWSVQISNSLFDKIIQEQMPAINKFSAASHTAFMNGVYTNQNYYHEEMRDARFVLIPQEGKIGFIQNAVMIPHQQAGSEGIRSRVLTDARAGKLINNAPEADYVAPKVYK